MIRAHDLDVLRTSLSGSGTPLAVPEGIVLGQHLPRQPQHRRLLQIIYHPHAARPTPGWIEHGEETGLLGPLMLATSLLLCPELRQFRHCFFSALVGLSADWWQWLGRGPGLTSSHDDTLTGMLLAAWYLGVLDKDSDHRFFDYSGSLEQTTTVVSMSYLRYTVLGYLASPLPHSIHILHRQERLGVTINSPLALGHASGTDTLLGFWFGQQIIEGQGMKTLIVALGDNVLLQCGEALTVENQCRNIVSAVPTLARLVRSYHPAIVHGNGPQVGLLSLQNLARKRVEPYPLDTLVAETQGMVGYVLAQSLAAEPEISPVTTVLTRIVISGDDPAFMAPGKFISPVYSSEEQTQLEAAYGWYMECDGKYLRRIVASPEPRQIVESDAIKLLLKEGYAVICDGGGDVPVTDEELGSEAVTDKDLSATLPAEQIDADGLVILIDADMVYENWGTPKQRTIRRASLDELALFAKVGGSMGPKITAVSGYVKQRGRPARIGTLSHIEDTLVGKAGTCIRL